MKKIIYFFMTFLLLIWIGVTSLGGLFGSIAGGTNSGCSTSSNKSITKTEEGSLSVSDEQLENAKKIAAVLKEYGLDDNKVYGAVGNAQAESSLTSPFTEMMNFWDVWKDANNAKEAVDVIQKHGTKAEAIFVNGWGTVAGIWANNGVSLDEATYRGGSPDGSHWVGFGIWQWTGYNGVMPYFDFTDENGLERVNIDNMLTFAVSDSSKYFEPYTAEGDFYYKRLEKIKAMPAAGSAAEGAGIWFNNYEFAGSGPSVVAGARGQYATDWAVRLGKESLDMDYAKSILSKANTVSAQSNNSKNTSKCSSKNSSSKGKGGHPYNHDYYWTAAFRTYNKARTIAAANFGFTTHNGIDVVADWGIGFSPKGSTGEIFSVYNGTVVGKSPSYGQILVKSEPSDTELEKPVVLEYTHLLIDGAYNDVQVGDKITAGQRLGTEGDTGSPGLHHLHFGVLNAEAVANAVNLWSGVNLDEKNYGGSVDDLIIDPGLVLEGIEVGWFDTAADNYLGDDFIQPNPLQIRVDGTTADDPRLAGKKK